MWLRRDYLRALLEACDLLISPSRHLARTYADWGVDAQKLHVIENVQRATRKLAPRRRASDDKSVIFGYFGQVTPYKGLDVLLEAIGLLDSSALKKFRLVINGANLDAQHDAWKLKLEELLDPWLKEGVVHWAGPYRETSLRRRMQAVDWVTVPSIWWENSPMVIQEALGFGRPVMCSNIGGMAEKVTHNENGWNVEVGDPMAWAEALDMAIRGEIDWPRLQAACVAGPTSGEIADEHLRLLQATTA